MDALKSCGYGYSIPSGQPNSSRVTSSSTLPQPHQPLHLKDTKCFNFHRPRLNELTVKNVPHLSTQDHGFLDDQSLHRHLRGCGGHWNTLSQQQMTSSNGYHGHTALRKTHHLGEHDAKKFKTWYTWFCVCKIGTEKFELEGWDIFVHDQFKKFTWSTQELVDQRSQEQPPGHARHSLYLQFLIFLT